MAKPKKKPTRKKRPARDPNVAAFDVMRRVTERSERPKGKRAPRK